MIKTIIFDLDGVLVDTKKIHFLSLNKSLKKIENYEITYQDHLKYFDGLPTNSKLGILLNDNRIKRKNLKKIHNLKQKYTNDLLKSEIKFNPNILNLFKRLKNKYKIAVATNSINKTLNLCLTKLKINKIVDFAISTDELNNTKPHPEIYLKCMIKLNSRPSETLVLEDSYYGRIAAREANILPTFL